MNDGKTNYERWLTWFVKHVEHTSLRDKVGRMTELELKELYILFQTWSDIAKPK